MLLWLREVVQSRHEVSATINPPAASSVSERSLSPLHHRETQPTLRALGAMGPRDLLVWSVMPENSEPRRAGDTAFAGPRPPAPLARGGSSGSACTRCA